MEHYLLSASSWSAHDLYTKYLKLPAYEQVAMFDKIMEKVMSVFIGWLLTNVCQVGSFGRRQLFYLTFVSNYCGLSRNGITTNHKFGLAVSLTMYDEMKQIHEHKASTGMALRSQQPNVEWFDNFCKFQSHSIPTLLKNTFSECLWTGVTMNVYVGPPVDTSVQRDIANSVISAMPDSILQEQNGVIQNINLLYPSLTDYLDRSLVHKFDVNSIPLKIDISKFPEEGPKIDTAKNNMTNIYPLRLIKTNIGSNRGLIEILRDYQDEHNMNRHGACTHYRTINVDENIYYRVLKVCRILI
jgi:hypothetical protein